MIRVLHVIDTSGLGGAERVFIDLVSGLDRDRFESIVAVPGADWLRDRLVEHGLDPIRIGSARGFDVGMMVQLRRIARAHRADVVHTHLLTTSVYASLALGLWGKPVVATFHGLDDIPASDPLAGVKCRILNRGVRLMVFVSAALRRGLLARTVLRDERSTVVYNGIDATRFHPGRDQSARRELGATGEEFLVGAVGNYSPAKGYDVLVHAAAHLLRTDPGYRFVVVGRAPGGAHEIHALMERLGVGDRVRFTGPRDDVPRMLRALAAFVLPSHTEGFSLSTVEAMASGLAVVATRSGGPEEILTDCVTGLLVDTNAPEQLAAALARLRQDGALRAALASRAAETAAQRFSVGAMVAAYERIYGDLCA